MDDPNRVLVFGDQAVDTSDSLRKLFKVSKRNAAVRHFLEVAWEQVRRSIAARSCAARLLHVKNSLLDLCDPVPESHRNVVQNTLLLCLNQLGWLCLELDQNGDLLRPAGKLVITGQCTGSLGAIAAAWAASGHDLQAITPQIIRIAINVGLAAHERSQSIECTTESWARVVHQDTKQLSKVLEDFNRKRKLPRHRNAYISALNSPASASVSGPPSSLKLLESFSPQSQRGNSIPIAGAFHAGHLSAPEPSGILGVASTLVSKISREVTLIFSSGKIYPAKNVTVKELLQNALVEIFQLQQDWPAIEASLSSLIPAGSSLISAVGSNCHSKQLNRLLQPASQRCLAESFSDSKVAAEGSVDEVAIVGASGRFPGSDGVDEFWEHLIKGNDLHKKVPASRFDVDLHYDPSGKTPNSTVTPYGCFYDNANLFDPFLFKISPREAEQMDPIMRLLLLSAYEALEQAGYSPDRPNSRHVASFFGQSSDDWREVNAGQNIDTFHIPGGIRAFGPGRLNYVLGWDGPSFGVDAACSSSAACIDLACNALLSGKCDAAIAGGGNILTSPDMFSGLSRAGVLSPTGGCKTWDKNADGYCRADAVGCVVLKRLRDAIADGDNVLGVIKSSATTHSPDAPSITRPFAPTQTELMSKLLKASNLLPEQIDYVEAHGTGTQAGDSTEATAIKAVFGDSRNPESPLYIGTVKPNVGHSESGSGVSSVIKALQMFKNSMIPPHVGIKTEVNPKMPDLASSNILIPMQAQPFSAHPQGDGKRRVIVNNFNITSGYSSLLIEDGFEPTRRGTDTRTSHIVAVSGHSKSALRGNLDRLEKFLSTYPLTNIADLGYTTTARRVHRTLRKAYIVSDVQELLVQLQRDVSRQYFAVPNPGPEAVFVFTGQGSQYAGMGGKLFEESEAFRANILRSDGICRSLGFPSFLHVITDNTIDIDDVSTIESQLALAALEVALAALWQLWGVSPSAVVGHSLGEYVAMHISGILSLSDMFFLIGNRAKLVQSACIAGEYSMLAVNAPAEQIAEILSQVSVKGCDISCHNSQNQSVVGGPQNAIADLCQTLDQLGIRSTLLNVPYAFHSSQMDPIAIDFFDLARNVPLNQPKIPFVSTVRGEVFDSDSIINSHHFVLHARNQVRFVTAVENLQRTCFKSKKPVWLEIGPTPVCTRMTAAILGQQAKLCLGSLVQKKCDWESMSTTLSHLYEFGLPINWQEYHRGFESALKLISLPSYAFDLKSYWIQYTGDWSLQKGRQQVRDKVEPTTAPTESTTLQKVESEEVDGDRFHVTFLSDVQEDCLSRLFQGHKVNGASLCSSSIYVDMAFTAGAYIWNRLYPDEALPALEMTETKVHKPLVRSQTAKEQLVRITAEKSGADSDVEIKVTTEADGETTLHATFGVSYGNGDKWKEAWAKQSYLYRSRVDYLRDPRSVGTQKLLSNMVYRLFSVLVSYSDNFRGIQELYLDGPASEATARVSLLTDGADGKFALSPYWVDSLAHISGFVLNGNDATSEDTVYISHGWRSFRLAEPLSADKQYTTYVKMQATKTKGLMEGDVYVFDGDSIAGVFTAVRFQAIKRQLLPHILPKDEPVSSAPAIPQWSLTREIVASPKLGKAVSCRGKSGFRRSRRTDSRVAISTPGIAALTSIAQELKIDASELDGERFLEDFGMDSLLIIETQTRLRTALGVDIPAELFMRPSNINQLITFIDDKAATLAPVDDTEDSDTSHEDSVSIATTSRENQDSQFTTLTDTSPIGMSQGYDSMSMKKQLRELISQEIGVSAADIQPSTNLADLGLDSLMTMSVLDAIKNKFGRTLPVDFFIVNSTWDEISAAFVPEVPAAAAFALSEPRVEKFKGYGTKPRSPSPPFKPLALRKKTSCSLRQLRSEHPSPSAVVERKPLIGPTSAPATFARPRTPPMKVGTTLLHCPENLTDDTPTLVLLPDGTGSPATFTSLPKIDGDLRVIGLSSPFYYQPQNFSLSVPELASLYVSHIKRVIAPKSTAPIILGGYSIGGIFAYEAYRQLLESFAPCNVRGLILLDAPCPTTLPALPLDAVSTIIDMLSSGGFFSRPGRSIKLPADVREHLRRSALALKDYKPDAPDGDIFGDMNCEAIWCTKGLLEAVGPDFGGKITEAVTQLPSGNNAAVQWVLNTRIDEGPQGWENLIGTVNGQGISADHFSFLKDDNVSDQLGELLRNAVRRLLA